MVIVKDELYGTIEFDETEGRIIDTKEFQRLRSVRQMSVTNLVYPGANHTRFEHSLGTSYLSSVIAGKLIGDEEERKKIKLFGLLHDIGHTAFSHEGEDVLKDYIGDHETVGKKIIEESGIADILNENYGVKKITEMFGKEMVVEADIGADRMDYLKRDAMNTGVAYGVIDMDRLVHTVSIAGKELCVKEGGLEAAESLLVARFMMFSTVYLHKTVRIATAMLQRAIKESIESKRISPEEFIWMGDEVAYWRMAMEGSGYAKGILERRLYKEVATIPQEKINREEAKKLEKELSGRFDCDIIFDYPTQFCKTVELKVLKKDGGLAPLVELSELVNSLRKAEEKRRRILVLTREEDRKKHGESIRKELAH
jgi:putative nucleotidyltransferase with HDIG domain